MAEGAESDVFTDTMKTSVKTSKEDTRPGKRQCMCSDGSEKPGSESDSISDREKMKAEMIEEMRKLVKEEMRTEMKEVMREVMKEVIKEVVKEEMQVILAAVNDIRETAEKVEKKVNDLEEQVKGQTEEVKSVRREVNEMKGEIGRLEDDNNVWKEKVQKLEEKMIDQNARSRRNNLVFYGVEEKGGREDCVAKVRELVAGKCGVTGEIGIDRAHRIPPGEKPAGTKPRPLICHFIDYSTRQAVKKAKKHLPRGINVADDLPPEIREARRQLTPALEEARAAKKDAFVAYPARLIVDNVEVMKIRPGAPRQATPTQRGS